MFSERRLKCSQTKVDFVPKEINVVILRYLVEIRLVGSIRSTCFGSIGEVCRKRFVLDKSRANGYIQGACV